MDPLTQGLLGAAVTQATWTHRVGRRAWLLGAVGGMAADLDIFIRSSSDPMVALIYHRHFTHSLAFVPIGGLVCALPWLLKAEHRKHAKDIIAGTTIGYATHALLDAFTSYGTLLYWPFSHERVAWSWIAIIDPIFTLALAVGVVMAARRVSAKPARWGLLAAALYLGVCGVQRMRALDGARALAAEQGHSVERIDAFPMLPANVVWRVLYVNDEQLHALRVRTPWFSGTQAVHGDTVDRVDLGDLPEMARQDPKTRRAYEVFDWFSSGWLGRSPDDPAIIGDQRYSADPSSTKPLWGIRLRPEQDPAVSFEQLRGDSSKMLGKMMDNLFGE